MTTRAAMLLAGAIWLAGMAEPAVAVEGNWAERVQVVYDAKTRSVSRINVRVRDPHPEKKLDFVWEPAAGNWPGVNATKAAQGQGRLVWRVRGSASYDPATAYSTYVGEMADGMPDGQGRLEYRTGEIFQGMFRDGYLDGAGLHVDAAGNRYEGDFRAGRAHGQGRYMARNGTIYEGGFVDGRRHGQGTMRLAGGTVYAGRWIDGAEVGPVRPDALADATIGGLLKAQAGGGDADRAEFTVVIDQRMTSRQEMQYQQLVRDEDIAIFPVKQDYNDAWNGGGLIGNGDYSFYDMDWDQNFAFVELGLATADKSRVRLEKLALEVQTSTAYRKPMLTLSEHLGCVGFRPDFSLANHGWGKASNARLSVQFSSPDRPGEMSRVFGTEIGTFEEGTEVSIIEPLRQAGVDTDGLSAGRYECPSRDQMNICRAQVFNSVDFGEAADFVWGDDVLYTTATGQIDYEWADDEGTVYQAAERFSADISLAVIEVDEVMAECGDGGGAPAAALRYIDVELPVGQSDYEIDLPVRGNKNVADLTTRLKMYSSMSSFHHFRAAASFADGSTRYSKPVSLFYFKPRISSYFPKESPAACYLDPGFGSSC